uniref:Ig-like domain-containing protein n=1 Tax=Amphiprion ocellaris TaxID=80972 RepID=A0A3Q1D4X7_AMPOC
MTGFCHFGHIWVILMTLTADLGQNVTMPCQFFGNKHNNITLLKWSRPDQGPDSYILLYEDGRFHPDKQLPSYKDRVYLEDMETRDFSLILMNVTMEDRGPYECDFVEEGWNQLNVADETLEKTADTSDTSVCRKQGWKHRRWREQD